MQYEYLVIFLREDGCGEDHTYMMVSAASEEEAEVKIDNKARAEALRGGHFDYHWKLVGEDTVVNPLAMDN
jgi:hypothetical protein